MDHAVLILKQKEIVIKKTETRKFFKTPDRKSHFIWMPNIVCIAKGNPVTPPTSTLYSELRIPPSSSDECISLCQIVELFLLFRPRSHHLTTILHDMDRFVQRYF